MADLSAFDITKRWSATNPDILQLYSLPTPNGVKVSIMLEETGIDYEPHFIDIGKDETWTPEFLSLNPNGKIPAIIDPNGPDGKPVGLFESGAILLYLAEKTGKFLPSDPIARIETIQWVFFQMAAIGPMFGQLGFSTNLPGASMRINARGIGTLGNPNVCLVFSKPVLPGVTGSWVMNIPLPISRPLAGYAIWSVSMMPGHWWIMTASKTFRHGLNAGLRVRR